LLFIRRQIMALRDDGKIRAWGAAVPGTPRLLTAMAIGGSTIAFLGLCRSGFFALLTEQSVLKILDLGILALTCSLCPVELLF